MTITKEPGTVDEPGRIQPLEKKGQGLLKEEVDWVEMK